MAPGGEVVGVFSIFSKEPRTEFTVFERGELAEFSALAMKDLNLQARSLADPELCSTPILQRDSLINADTQQTRNSCSHIPENKSAARPYGPDMFPPPLRYHKEPASQPRLSLFRNSQSGDIPSGTSYRTPPSSSRSYLGDSMDHPRGFRKNHKQLSVNSTLNYISSSHELITPDSRDFEIPSPRPFSASDLTSLDPHPPNTPIQSLINGELPKPPQLDLTVENFMSLTDLDCAEESPDSTPSQSSSLLNYASPNTEFTSSPTAISSPISPHLTVSSISTTTSSRSGRSAIRASKSSDRIAPDPMAEAAFSCAFSAQSLGYDLIYAVEIHPAGSFMTDEQLLAPGGLRKRILCAYGLDQPLELSSEVHLRVLRCRGYELWVNSAGYQHEDGEYQSGCLIPIKTDGRPRKTRNSGIVFGAFRKLKPIESGTVHSASSDVERLLDAANVLKDILLKFNVRKPRKANTEPSSPNRYPANEATEVGKFSLDAQLDRK